MHTKRFITLSFLTVLTAAVAAMGAVGTAGGGGFPPASEAASGLAFPCGAFFASLPGVRMEPEEAEGISGGDVRMRFMPGLGTMEVEVVSNEYEARLGRIPPVRYRIDAHNRIVDTTGAPFFPTADSAAISAGIAGLTARAAAFPEGYWAVTAIRERQDRFGPYMISTNAWGNVDIYQDDGKGGRRYVGNLPDTGYSIHSNARPFEQSASYGCIVIREADAARLARDLMADRMDAQLRWDRDPPQSLRVERDM